jgi:LysM repeat protein
MHSAWSERSDGYGEAEEEVEAGIWDEDTAEMVSPSASGRQFVNMRARAGAMSGLAADWGRARPEARLPGESHRRPWLRGSSHRIGQREIKLPPAWVMLNMLILLVAVALAVPHVFAAETNSCGWYSVQPGDTIPAIAQRYHASAQSVFDANHLTASQKLSVGQQLCIPSRATSDTIVAPAISGSSGSAGAPGSASTPGTAGAASAPTPAPTPTPAPVAPTPAPTKPSAISGSTAFIQFVLPYAQRAHAATGWSTSVIIAQWGVEHGWKLPSFTGYNFGNVASLPGEPTVPGTAAWGSPSHFSYAPTPEDGLRQYVKVAQLKYYAPVTAASKVGANTAAIALGKSPWDAGHYGGASNPGGSLLGVMKSFNLYAYD